MEKEIPFTGILSNNAEENSDFFNWNRVKLRYCDGASFTGNSEDKGVQKNLPRICTNHLDPTSGIAVATKAQFDSTDLALLELAWIQLIQENKPVTKKELAKSDSQDAYAKKAI